MSLDGNRIADVTGTLDVTCRLTGELLGSIELHAPAGEDDSIAAHRCEGPEGPASSGIFANMQDALAWVSDNPAVPRPGARRSDIVAIGHSYCKRLAMLPCNAMLTLPLSGPAHICAVDDGETVARIRRTEDGWSVGSMTGGDTIAHIDELAEAIGLAIGMITTRRHDGTGLSGHEHLAWKTLEAMFEKSCEEPVSGFVRDIEETLTQPVAGKAFQTRNFA